MIATAYVQNGAKVYIASRKEKQLKEVRNHARVGHTRSLKYTRVQVSEQLNQIRPGSCDYVVADLSVSHLVTRVLLSDIYASTSSQRPVATTSSRPLRPRKVRSTSSSTTPACRGAPRSMSMLASCRVCPSLVTLPAGHSPNSFPEKSGWDRLLALNVKSIFYGSCCHAFCVVFTHTGGQLPQASRPSWPRILLTTTPDALSTYHPSLASLQLPAV